MLNKPQFQNRNIHCLAITSTPQSIPDNRPRLKAHRILEQSWDISGIIHEGKLRLPHLPLPLRSISMAFFMLLYIHDKSKKEWEAGMNRFMVDITPSWSGRFYFAFNSYPQKKKIHWRRWRNYFPKSQSSAVILFFFPFTHTNPPSDNCQWIPPGFAIKTAVFF